MVESDEETLRCLVSLRALLLHCCYNVVHCWYTFGTLSLHWSHCVVTQLHTHTHTSPAAFTTPPLLTPHTH
jgi:hypothetical protein